MKVVDVQNLVKKSIGEFEKRNVEDVEKVIVEFRDLSGWLKFFVVLGVVGGGWIVLVFVVSFLLGLFGL